MANNGFEQPVFKIQSDEMQRLLDALRQNGYRTLGPIIKDEAIVYDEISTVGDLPRGWTDEQGPASYRLVKRNDDAYFGFNVPAQSWKKFLYPSERELFRVRRDSRVQSPSENRESSLKYAFIGVRPCELKAISIQDRVFTSTEYKDESYSGIRHGLFIVAVNCTSSGDDCFCASMKTGPMAKRHFDLSLTEVIAPSEHYFLVEHGNELGASFVRGLNATEASEAEMNVAGDLIERAGKQTRRIEIDRTPELLSARLDHPEWNVVAKKCLTCGNCTLVCPTCFCSTVEDTTDLIGSFATRRRKWDSCFTLDFAKVAGGNFRMTSRSRYRQWVTHKLSTWVEQFGTLGCVGCGRCITWCPVGIDIISEVQKITET